MSEKGIETATLGGGCFWCLEAVYLELRGVRRVDPGYAGGHVADPTYPQVCTGATGHAEVVRIRFAPDEIAFRELLEVFFTIHDPTSLNRQGADVGTQYRSAIFHHSPEQEAVARDVIAELEARKLWRSSIATELVAAGRFFMAEDEHRNYFARNPDQGYCRAVVAPKVAKARAKFFDKLREPPASG